MFRSHYICRLLPCVLAVSAVAPAQVDRATLTGAIFDPSNANVVGAAVTVSFEETGFKRTVQSNASGLYVLPALPLGKCRITVQANGFQTQAESIMLAVGETRTQNFQLALAASSETVEVTAVAVDLEQSTAETGGFIGSQ